MSQADDFMRAQGGAIRSSVAGSRTSLSNSMMRNGMKMKKKVDPYALDFTELRNKYVEDTTIQIPFVKSSFVHYSKCPRNMTINGTEYKDLVITMEVVQAPTKLSYTQLDDPKAVRAAQLQAKKDEKIAAKKAEMKKIRDEKKAEKNVAKEIKQLEKEERAA